MSDNWLKALVLACIFGTVLLIVDTLIRFLASRGAEVSAINLRLKLIGQGRARGEVMNMLRRSESGLPEGLPQFLKGMATRFEYMLMAAQVSIPTSRLALIILITPFVIFFGSLAILVSLGWVVTAGKLLLMGTFAVAIGAALPLLLLQLKANRTRRKMQDQFPIALDVFVRGLRAGHPIAAALDLLTVEMPDPIGSQFGTVVDEVTYGAELRDALQSLADRWQIDDIKMFVVSLSVQSETGGNLAEILENLSKVIRERQAMMLKVRALSSEGRMTAIMLTALPILAFTVLFMVNPRFYLDVADDPAFVPGFVSLILLYCVGFYTIRRMVDLKV